MDTSNILNRIKSINSKSIAISLIVVIILLFLFYSPNLDLSNTVFEADDAFLNDAGLEVMYLYINEKKRGNLLARRETKYDGYLYVENQDGAIEDQKIELTLYKRQGASGYNLHIDNISLWEADIVQMRYDQKTGIMTIYDQDTVYAELYKNNILSDYSNKIPIIDDSE